MSFEMMSSDNQSVTVKLKVPLRESLSEIVEVYGNVDERGNIVCVNYATFDQSAISNFDMDLYNETITMTHQVPKHYIQAVWKGFVYNKKRIWFHMIEYILN